MDASKMVTIQHQIRQNQEEFNEYVMGLSSWADDMKAKEEKLKSAAAEPASVEVPPVRNSLLKKKKKKKVKIATEQTPAGDSKKTKKISAYDYRAWDRFNADAAADAVDETNKPKEEEEYETDEEWEEERRILLAKEEKDKGNAHFKAGRWDAAVECYTTALRLDPVNPVLLTNRAMAQLRAERLGAAEADCSAALRLQPDNCKAVYRRALARKGLGRSAEALEDFERVLELDPGSKAARTEVEALEKIVRPTGEVKPVSKDEATRSKKPLRRLKIEEVGFAESSIPARPTDKALGNFLRDKEKPKTVESVRNKEEEIPSKTEASVESVVKKAEKIIPKTEEKIVEVPKETVPSSTLPDFPTPRNFSQFESAFASLTFRRDAALLNDFLLAIPAGEYARVFGQCLEPRHVNALVDALATADDEKAAEGVRALRKVPRFSFLAMMSGEKAREAMRGLRQRLKEAGRLKEDEFAAIGREFRL